MKEFELGAGSIIGKDHLFSVKNSQDAHYFSIQDNYIIALVADGCGSSLHSEVGSKIGVRLIGEALRKHCSDINCVEKTRQDALAEIRILANQMGGSFTNTVINYFLFTIIGTLITPETTLIFSQGDGLIGLNGELAKLTAWNNCPPYLSYALLKERFPDADPAYFKSQIHKILPTNELNNLIIATDGIFYFIDNEKIAGPIRQFWEEDKYFKNPDMIRRKFAQLNRKDSAILRDDTTAIVIRRR